VPSIVAPEAQAQSNAHAGIISSCLFSRQPKQFFKDCALFFFSTDEESSQPTKHDYKIIISMFLIMKATNLDTHGSCFKISEEQAFYSTFG